MTEHPENPETPDTENPPRPEPRGHRLRFAILALVAIAILVAGAFLWWGLTPFGPSPEAMTALEDSAWVDVTDTSYGWRFLPRDTTPATGIVLYPGGRVDARSYAPLAHEIASRGHVVSIVTFPLSLAVLSPNSADLPIEQERYVEHWVLAGHSLGGVMGARYAQANPDTVAGVLLLASYPDDAADLSASALAGASITGTLDGVLDVESWEAARGLLPTDTAMVEIEGGNHSQFGSYGLQPGDNPATISESEQRKRIANVANELLKQAATTTVP